MKIIYIVVTILIVLGVVEFVKANGTRLEFTSDSVCKSQVCVHVLYDKHANVDCYVAISDQLTLNGNRSNSIYCLSVKPQYERS